jgi:hypothetical protein
MRFTLLEDFASIEAAYLTLDSLKVAKHYRDNRNAYLHLIDVLRALDESVKKHTLDPKSLLKIDDVAFRKHVRTLSNSS